ncbi:type II toxin-antitoxin system VapC family toxin [Thiocapsa rosea]|uniref:PIN domain nuclease of toxin-antitoxin system n=1 Tax=Thiocapsa rosea TaxID=69360 RepID=A0A495V1R7_9GAMM|nr:type II toxin-antitoxin system VapC family toxin [Thiocapsa rosea]RKT43274.1 PIN domain nuclease of toxin-antitoxin system [Thiocapsa rosea]
MRLLLDTCILYDWMMDALADPETVALIQQTGAFVSAVAVWEMSIKHALGKMTLPSRKTVEDVGAQGFGWLNITPSHAQAVLDLPAHHKDPFDRLLIAQAQCEGMQILTYDRLFRDYLPETRLVRQ